MDSTLSLEMDNRIYTNSHIYSADFIVTGKTIVAFVQVRIWLNLHAVFFQGWYIITYGLGIYHLNLIIAFLTPKVDPALDFDGNFD